MRRDEPHREPSSEPGLAIRLFGGMAIQDAHGIDYLPRSRKTRAIVAMLALTAPKAAQRGQLTGLLWSLRAEQQGRASLRQAVHELQWTLGSAWNHILLAERHCLTIDLRGVTVDALEAVAPAASKTALLPLFEDGFLQDLDGLDPAFDNWLAKERRRLAALARIGGEAFLEEHHPREMTIPVARSLLRLEPANDGAWRALIEAHIEASDRAAARLACEQWGEALGLGPDDTPPEELAAFLARIRFGSTRRPRLKGSPETGAGAAGEPPREARGGFPSGAMETVITPDRAIPDRRRTIPEPPPATGTHDGLLADRVTPGRVMPDAAIVERAPPVRVVSDAAAPEQSLPEGVSEDVVRPGAPAVPDASPLYRIMPGATLRDTDPASETALARVMETPILPLPPAMPGRIMPDGFVPGGLAFHGLVPDAAPTGGVAGVMEGVIVPSGPPATEVWDAATAPWMDARPARSSLRIGIREMRVIGSNVDQALSAGLAEEVTMALSRFRWISCVSGSSLAAMGGETGDGTIRWSDLDLDLLLDGTIQGGGERVRITVRLLDMRAGEAVIWANRFDHDASDTLTVQDRVAAAIVAQVDPLLLVREGDRAGVHNQPGASPRDLVLQAVPAIYRMDRLSFRAAGELLEEALRVDQTHTDALAWYAYWHLFLVGQGWADDADAAIARAGMLADTAVAMDPNDARALTLAGHVRGFLLRRPSEAAVLHERAIALNPNLALAWCFSGFTLSYMGDHATALTRMNKAIELSPSDPHLFFFQAATIMPHLLLGQYREAAAAGREAVELNPWFSSSFKGLLAALGHLGEARQAASVMARLLKLEPDFNVRDAIARSPMGLEADIERYADGLRRAGLPEW